MYMCVFLTFPLNLCGKCNLRCPSPKSVLIIYACSVYNKTRCNCTANTLTKTKAVQLCVGRWVIAAPQQKRYKYPFTLEIYLWHLSKLSDSSTNYQPNVVRARVFIAFSVFLRHRALLRPHTAIWRWRLVVRVEFN